LILALNDEKLVGHDLQKDAVLVIEVAENGPLGAVDSQCVGDQGCALRCVMRR